MWIALDEARIQTRLTAPELSVLKTAALAGSQTSSGLLSSAITAITNKVRGFVGGCARNTLGPAGTIPDELEDAALALLRRYLFTRLPNSGAIYDKIRQDEAADADKLMEQVAACKFGIVPPEEPAAEQAGGTRVQLISSRPRQATREKLSGL